MTRYEYYRLCCKKELHQKQGCHISLSVVIWHAGILPASWWNIPLWLRCTASTHRPSGAVHQGRSRETNWFRRQCLILRPTVTTWPFCRASVSRQGRSPPPKVGGGSESHPCSEKPCCKDRYFLSGKDFVIVCAKDFIAITYCCLRRNLKFRQNVHQLLFRSQYQQQSYLIDKFFFFMRYDFYMSGVRIHFLFVPAGARFSRPFFSSLSSNTFRMNPCQIATKGVGIGINSLWVLKTYPACGKLVCLTHIP